MTQPALGPFDPTPAVGEQAPDFTLRDQHGQDVTLSEVVRAGPALIVFYPFAFSRICTAELRTLRDELASFTDAGVQVLAVSCDPTYALKAYGAAEGIGFPLLSDFWPHGQKSDSSGNPMPSAAPYALSA